MSLEETRGIQQHMIAALVSVAIAALIANIRVSIESERVSDIRVKLMRVERWIDASQKNEVGK